MRKKSLQTDGVLDDAEIAPAEEMQRLGTADGSDQVHKGCGALGGGDDEDGWAICCVGCTEKAALSS